MRIEVLSASAFRLDDAETIQVPHIAPFFPEGVARLTLPVSKSDLLLADDLAAHGSDLFLLARPPSLKEDIDTLRRSFLFSAPANFETQVDAILQKIGARKEDLACPVEPNISFIAVLRRFVQQKTEPRWQPPSRERLLAALRVLELFDVSAVARRVHLFLGDERFANVRTEADVDAVDLAAPPLEKFLQETRSDSEMPLEAQNGPAVASSLIADAEDRLSQELQRSSQLASEIASAEQRLELETKVLGQKMQAVSLQQSLQRLSNIETELACLQSQNTESDRKLDELIHRLETVRGMSRDLSEKDQVVQVGGTEHIAENEQKLKETKMFEQDWALELYNSARNKQQLQQQQQQSSPRKRQEKETERKSNDGSGAAAMMRAPPQRSPASSFPAPVIENVFEASSLLIEHGDKQQQQQQHRRRRHRQGQEDEEEEEVGRLSDHDPREDLNISATRWYFGHLEDDNDDSNVAAFIRPSRMPMHQSSHSRHGLLEEDNSNGHDDDGDDDDDDEGDDDEEVAKLLVPQPMPDCRLPVPEQMDLDMREFEDSHSAPRDRGVNEDVDGVHEDDDNDGYDILEQKRLRAEQARERARARAMRIAREKKDLLERRRLEELHRRRRLFELEEERRRLAAAAVHAPPLSRATSPPVGFPATASFGGNGNGSGNGSGSTSGSTSSSSSSRNGNEKVRPRSASATRQSFDLSASENDEGRRKAILRAAEAKKKLREEKERAESERQAKEEEKWRKRDVRIQEYLERSQSAKQDAILPKKLQASSSGRDGSASRERPAWNSSVS